MKWSSEMSARCTRKRTPTDTAPRVRRQTAPSWTRPGAQLDDPSARHNCTAPDGPVLVQLAACGPVPRLPAPLSLCYGAPVDMLAEHSASWHTAATDKAPQPLRSPWGRLCRRLSRQNVIALISTLAAFALLVALIARHAPPKHDAGGDYGTTSPEGTASIADAHDGPAPRGVPTWVRTRAWTHAPAVVDAASSACAQLLSKADEQMLATLLIGAHAT